MKIFLLAAASILSLSVIVGAVPAKVSKVQQDAILPLDTEPFVTFTVKDKEFKIERKIAKKSVFLKTLIENDLYETNYHITDLEPERFSTVMDYLNDPNCAKEQWRIDEIPQLINTANYFLINSMLGDLLRYQCHDFNHKPVKEIEKILSKISVPELKNVLLYCANENAPDDWTLKRKEFRDHCKTDIMDVFFSILNPQPLCLKYIKQQNLQHMLSTHFRLEFSNLYDLDASAEHLRGMDYRIGLVLEYRGFQSELFESLKNVPDLNYLRIQNLNSEVPEILDMQHFPAIPKLQELGIYECKLENVDDFLKKEFPELIMLNLYKNQITKVGKIEFMPNLETLKLELNQISIVSQLLSSDLPNLSELSLKMNQIENVGRIQSMQHLSRLNLDSNRVCDVSELLKSPLRELSLVSLVYNPIKKVEKGNLMPKLQIRLRDPFDDFNF